MRVVPSSYRPTPEEFQAQDRVYNMIIVVCLAYVAGYCLVKGAAWPIAAAVVVALVGAVHGLTGRGRITTDDGTGPVES